MTKLPRKDLYGIKWKHIRHCFWQSETLENRTYLMCINEPIAYQEFDSCNFVFSSVYLVVHKSTKVGISKWVGLGGTEIKEMIKTNQYKIVPHTEFQKELWKIGEIKRKGVR
jgi:hypothetical protein